MRKGNDREIFDRLRDIGEGVVRIDERTQRMDADEIAANYAMDKARFGLP